MPPQSLFLSFCQSPFLRLVEWVRWIGSHVIRDESLILGRVVDFEKFGLLLRKLCVNPVHVAIGMGRRLVPVWVNVAAKGRRVI